jgi:AsmA protein
MKKLIIGFLTLCIMLILLAVLVPFLIPAEEFKGHILALAEEKLGRKLSLNGPIEFVLLPDISLQLHDVEIANAEGFEGPHLATVEQVRLKLALKPLLQRNIVVEELIIDRPAIQLQKDKWGKENWQFNTKENSKKTAPATASQPAHESKKTAPMAYNIRAIHIADARIHYQSPEQKISLQNVTLDYSKNALKLLSELSYNGLNMRPRITIHTPDHLLTGQSSPIDFSLQHAPAELSFTGTLSGIHINQSVFSPKLEGALNIQADSLHFLEKLLGDATRHPLLARPFQLDSSQLRADSNGVEFVTLQADIAGLKMAGHAAASFAGKKPSLSASLDIDKLDVKALMPPPATDAEANTAAEQPPAQGSPKAAEGWSKKPFDFSVLQKLDADLKLTIDTLTQESLTLKNVQLAMKLHHGKLDGTLNQAKLEDGSLSASFVLDSSRELPRWDKKLTLNNLPFEALTGPFMEKARIHGKTNGNLSFQGAGNSLHEWIHSLSGNGQLTLSDGIIEGYALPRLFRHVKSSYDPSVERNTPFSKMAMDFTADQGIIQLHSMQLEAPLLQAHATGKVSLKGRHLDIYTTPKIVPKLDSENTADTGGVMVPLRISGPWNNITITPDLQAAIREAISNPESLKNAAGILREEGRAIRKEFKKDKSDLKAGWEALKEQKSPDSLHNMLDVLKNIGGARVDPAPAQLPEPPQ